MAEDQSKPSRWIHFRENAGFETKRMEGVLAEKTATSAICLYFYVERPAVEGRVRWEVLEDGSLGKILENESGKEEVVVEFQQGILLDPSMAQTLRDRLDEILKIAAQ